MYANDVAGKSSKQAMASMSKNKGKGGKGAKGRQEDAADHTSDDSQSLLLQKPKEYVVHCFMYACLASCMCALMYTAATSRLT